MRSLATPFSTLAALALPLAVAAQGYPVMADPMAPGVPPGGVIGAPAMGVPAMGAPAVGAPALGAPLVGAPVGGAQYGGGAVVVSPGQQLQGGLHHHAPEQQGHGRRHAGESADLHHPEQRRRDRDRHAGLRRSYPDPPEPRRRNNHHRSQSGDDRHCADRTRRRRHRRAGWNGVRRADAAGDLHPATGLRAAGGDLQALTLSRLRRAARIADRARKK